MGLVDAEIVLDAILDALFCGTRPAVAAADHGHDRVDGTGLSEVESGQHLLAYHLQEAGATPVQEVGFALATAVAVLDAVRCGGQVSPSRG